MARMGSDGSQDSPHHDDGALRIIDMAAVAAVLFDPAGARALLEIPDAELGRLFKIRLMRIAGLSTALNLDVSSTPGRMQSASNEGKRGSKRGKLARYDLIAKGRLLHLTDFLTASDISEHRLAKDLAARRLFSVEIGRDAYYPAFFLVDELDRKALAKVSRRLGNVAGWRKWKFFTTPKMTLGNSTPLQALMRGDAKQVLRSAAAFADK